MKQVFTSRSSIGGTGSFFPIGFGGEGHATEARAQSIVLVAGTISKLKITLTVAPGGGKTRVYTVRKNGADTTVTVSFGAADTVLSDLSNTVTVAVGDRISLRQVDSGGPAACDILWSTEFDSGNNYDSMYPFGIAGYGTNLGTTWLSPLSCHSISAGGAWAATELAGQAICGVAGTFTAMRIAMANAPSAGNSRTFVIYKNGVAQDGTGGTPNTTITIADTATSGSSSFALTVSPRDRLVIRHDAAGASCASDVGNWGGLAFTADSAGYSHFAGKSVAVSDTNTEYFVRRWTVSTTETNETVPGGVTSVTLQDFYVRLSAAPGSGNNYAITARNNAATTGLSVIITDSAETGSDAGSFTFADGDRFSVQSVPTSTPSAVHIMWAMAMVDAVAVSAAPPIDYEDPCTIQDPRLHLKIEDSTQTLRYAVTPLRDSSTLGGFKEPRILEVGPITRQASSVIDGSWSAQTATATLADTDRQNRAASDAAGTMRGMPAEIYLSSKAQSLVDGPPRILFSGEIYKDSALSNLAFQITINDMIGRLYTLSGEERKIPQRFVNASDFVDAPAASLGLGVPIIYGEVQDLGNPPTGGTIPGIYVGTLDIGGTDYEAVLCCGHAITEFLTTNASTPPGGPSIWIDPDPNTNNNIPLDASLLGTDWWAPQIPGDVTWAAEFGADQFTDINPAMAGPTRRYTLILFRVGSDYGDAVAAGASIHFDCIGIEDVGDGTGTAITDYFQQYLHALTNWLLQNYQYGAWLSIPQFVFSDGVTMLDRIKSTSFTTASTVFERVRGVAPVGGFVLNTRQSIRDVIKNLNFSIGCFFGQDDYGRLFVRVLDNDRSEFLTNQFTGVVHRTLRDKLDILPGMSAEPDPGWFCDWLRHQWGYSYLNGTWDSGFAPVTGSNEDAETNVQRTIQLPYIRDDDTAAAVGAYYLQLLSADPKLVRYSRRGLCGLEDDVLTGLPLTHYNGYGIDGYEERALLVLTKVFNPKTMHCDFIALDCEPYLTTG